MLLGAHRPGENELLDAEIAALEHVTAGHAQLIWGHPLPKAAVDPADPKAEQWMARRGREDLGHRIPAGLGQEALVQQAPESFEVVPRRRGRADAEQAGGHQTAPGGARAATRSTACRRRPCDGCR